MIASERALAFVLHPRVRRRIDRMKQWIALCCAVLCVLAADRAWAQEVPPVPPLLEITVIPGGGVLFLESEDASAPSFGSYQLGAAVAYNINRFLGVEGEVGGSLGIEQDLDFGYTSNVRTPDMLTYSGNLVVSAPTGTAVVPYVTGGIGGLSLFSREEFGVDDTETLFTTNVGGGVKWNPGRFGLRADYRFIAIPSRDSVSAFGFGTEARYGHRVYGAVILNIGR
jgi:Outer membrane protein beta-barrel domain